MSQERRGLLAVLVLQAFLGGILIIGDFTGPDATSYMSFVRAGQDPSYWLDPDAFEGNFFPMGYPAILTLTVALAGGSTLLYEIASVLMALLVTTLIFKLLRGHSDTVRVTTALALALCPSVLWMMQNNGYEMLLSCLIVVSFYLVWRLRNEASVHPRIVALSAGLTLGAAGLVQSKVLVLLPLYLILLLRTPLQMGLVAAGTVVLPGLWGLRNLLVTGNPFPFSSNAGTGLWLGNNPYTIDGGVASSMPSQGSRSLPEAALQFVLSQPEAAFTLFGRRVARLLNPTYLYRDGMLPEVNNLLHWYAIVFVSLGVLLFAAFAFGRLWIRFPVSPDVTAFALVVLAFFVVHFPFQSEPRYMTPVVPLALAVSVPTAFALLRRTRKKLHERLARDKTG